ncbi:MAG: AAA family ATPase [Pyrinomonadaceae bacterium]
MENEPVPPEAAVAVVPTEVKNLVEIFARTRNVLLYGPPGTGKTYNVRQFAEHFLRPQMLTSSAQQQRLSVLQNLRWYEAIALAMTFANSKVNFKVNELKSDALLRDYAQLRSSAKLSNGAVGTAPNSRRPGQRDR